MQSVWRCSSVRIAIAAMTVLAIGGRWLAERAESQQPQPVARPGVFAVLKPGQSLALRETGGSYELSIMPGVNLLSHQVVEVGTDYVVVRDTTTISELRIPIYSIKAVVTQQKPRP